MTLTHELRPSLASRALTGFGWNHAGKLLDYASSYAFSLLVVRFLTVQENTLYVVLVTVLQIALVACALGLEQCLNRYVPQLAAAGVQGRSRYLVGRAFVVRLAVSTVVGGVLALAAPLLARMLHLAPEARALLPVVGVLVVGRSVTAFWTSALLGRLRAGRAALASLAARVVEIVSLVVLFGRGGRLGAVVLSLVLGMVTMLAAYVPVMRQELSGPRERMDLKPAAWFAAACWGNLFIGLMLGRQLDVVLLNLIAPEAGAVAHYDVAATLYVAVSAGLGIGLAGVSLAVFAETRAHAPSRTGQLYLTLVKIVALPLIGVFTFLLTCADQVVPLIYSGRYQASVAPFRVFAGFAVFGAVFGSSLNTDMLLADGRASLLAMMGLAGGLLNVVLDLVLIPLAGATGAALASATAGTASVAFISYRVRRERGLALPWRFLVTAVGGFALAAVPVLVTRPASPIGLALACAAYGAIGLAALAVLRPLDAEDALVLDRLPFGLASVARGLTRPARPVSA